jgi:hypothetical protein
MAVKGKPPFIKKPIELDKKVEMEIFTTRVSNMLRNFDYLIKPDCFNGIVSIHKYRITVELIEEPIEVLKERLEKLYSESDNWHDREPLEAMAKKLGITIDSEFGSAKKEKNNAL